MESILISVMSMLIGKFHRYINYIHNLNNPGVPNLDSPANIDAAKAYKEDVKSYKKMVRRLVRQSEDSYYN